MSDLSSMDRCPVLERGKPCGLPAKLLDPERNIVVCAKHAPRCKHCKGMLFQPSPDGLHDRCRGQALPAPAQQAAINQSPATKDWEPELAEPQPAAGPSTTTPVSIPAPAAAS